MSYDAAEQLEFTLSTQEKQLKVPMLAAATAGVPLGWESMGGFQPVGPGQQCGLNTEVGTDTHFGIHSALLH